MKQRDYLRHRYRVLFGYVGGIWIIIGLTILSPLLLLIAFPDELQYAYAFAIAGSVIAIMGSVLRWQTPLQQRSSLSLQEGMVVIVIAWVSAILVGAIPMMLINDLTFTQAIFEATSGWTTTGLTVVNVEQAPRLLLFYRSVMQLVGGAGFAIIVLSAITGPTGAGISLAEGRDDLLAPNVRYSANIVLRLYGIYVVAGFVALMLAGMGWFDALNHAFTALSTGGFSTRAQSIGYFQNPTIEVIIMVLMVLGSVNYFTAYAFVRGRFKSIFKNGELRLFITIFFIGMLLLLMSSGDDTLWDRLRTSSFGLVSALSTTGFSTDDYGMWMPFGWMVLIIVMLIGGGSGSTAGGIKQFRVYVLFQALVWEVRRAFFSQYAVNEAKIWQGDHSEVLTDQQVRRIALFTLMYLVMFFLLVVSMVAHQSAIGEAMFEAASTLSTVGLSIGMTSSATPASLLWLQSIGMLLGRLEFFALVIGLLKLNYDLRDMLR